MDFVSLSGHSATGISMKPSPKNWIVLTYWALLMSLGPSFHHASFLGFHADLDQEFRMDVAGCRCCSHAVPTESAPQEGPIAESTHDCSLCEFFKHCHLSIAGFVFDESADKLGYRAELPIVKLSGVCFTPNARGPPVA